MPSNNDPLPKAAPKRTMRNRGQAARARGLELRGQLEGQREEHASIETGFCWLQRDKDIAGGVLGGGLAYRFFFWILALSVFVAGGLGFASTSGADVEEGSQDVGVTNSLARIIASAADQSESARWWLVLSGLVLVLWSSYGLLLALHLVHAAVWRISPPPLRNLPKAVAFVLAAPVVLFAATAAAGWVRAHSTDPVGLAATLAIGVCFGAVWIWVSMYLPSQDVPWTAFLPGAILFGVGLEALHVFTTYFLEAKLANASELYGVLGLATTALFVFFLIGRGVIWAAELNAVLWDVRMRRR